MTRLHTDSPPQFHVGAQRRFEKIISHRPGDAFKLDSDVLLEPVVIVLFSTNWPFCIVRAPQHASQRIETSVYKKNLSMGL